ncbi:MAG: SCP2 sterol-binding domain-containing protein [Actinomycetota bacterium]|nr:SCP2 sterol-binding domain-containing protein [Actinomycetota bacterium]
MAEWLSPAWVEESTAAVDAWPFAGDRPPAPVALTVTVTGGTGGDVTYRRHWWPADGAEERDLAVTVPAAEAGAILAGELSPSVAFMRGRLKTSGDAGAVLDVLAASATSSFIEVLARLRGATS